MPFHLQYASDLHIEFPENREFLKLHPLQALGDVLVLAGDIVPFALLNKHMDFFRYLADHFATTYWVPGNHEYYHSDISERCGVINEKILSNVFLINNTSVVHDNARLIFSTLWSHISPGYQWQIERGLNDFRLIKDRGYRFSAERYNQLHKECLGFITEELRNNKNEKTVVFTHHVPTMMNYPPQYKGDILNEAFATELFDLIETSQADYWIYGHLHASIKDFVIGKTKMSANQLGYVQLNEHHQFDTNKVVEL